MPTPLPHTSRADLLRALAAGIEGPITLDHSDQGWCGFVLRPPVAEEESAAALALAGIAARPHSAAQPPPVDEPYRLPLRMPSAWVVQWHEVQASAQPLAEREVQPLREEDLAPASAEIQVEHQPLVPWARVRPALQRELSRLRPGALDLHALAAACARMQPPRHLPRRQRRAWPEHLVVVLDFSAHLWPYRHDMHQLCHQLRRQLGHSSLELRVLPRGPGGGWQLWRSTRERRALFQAAARASPTAAPAALDDEFTPRPWGHLPGGAQVLLVGDMGQLQAQAAVQGEWTRFVARLGLEGHRVRVMAPLGARLAELGASWPLLRWSPDSAMRPVGTFRPVRPFPSERLLSPASTTRPMLAPRAPVDLDALNELLALVAVAQRVDPPLLRELRRLNTRTPLDAALEGALWAHPDIDAGAECSVKADAAARHLQRFDGLTSGLQQAQRRLSRRHHAHLRAMLHLGESLRFAAHAQDADDAETRLDLERAIQRLEGLHATLARVPAQAQVGRDAAAAAARRRWLMLAATLVQQADALTRQRFKHLFDPLEAHLAQDLSDENTADVRPAVRPAGWLLEDSRGLVFKPGDEDETQARPGQVRHARLQPSWVLRWRSGGGERTHTRIAPAHEVVLCAAGSAAAAIEVDTGQEQVRLVRVARPRGAVSFAVQQQALSVKAPTLGVPTAQSEPFLRVWFGEGFRIEPAKEGTGLAFLAAAGHGQVRVSNKLTLQWTLDPFGVALHITLTTAHGQASQRLRWLEPGMFLMGSPEGKEGHDDERPQHRVTLTQGLWLADTPCTQALWQAVMGENPSEFQKGPEAPQRPVEQVSWDDVQQFLARLQALLPPGCEAGLPTEAQWEYAARAGSITAYAWGAAADDGRANWGGKHRGTTPVGQFASNAWGLHDMHGNVLEWCADGAFRNYSSAPQVNPIEPAGAGAPRAVRGGSWRDEPAGARSAYRRRNEPGLRWSFLGFRLALRSQSPGPGGPVDLKSGPGGTTGPRRPEAARRLPAEPAGARGLLDTVSEWLGRTKAPTTDKPSRGNKPKKR